MAFSLPRIAVILALLLGGAPVQAQELSLSLGGDGTLSGNTVQLILLLTILSLAPGIAVMVTCFPFIITVMSILRQAIGLQQSPPNMMLVSLALFLTYFIMDPVFTAAWSAGVRPLTEGALPLDEAFVRGIEPFRIFMAARVDPETLNHLLALRPDALPRGDPQGADPQGDLSETALSVLIPAFMLSEISRAFEIGFIIFLPFLVIDLVVAAVLMSMGMMMVPPAIVALPFKLAFFVVADGWTLLSTALVQGYV
ncbi:flagellar type III secretion system pore protein FliP [Roseicitreum antarcticum]|uniref:Flagellar biosynthetic protein FliP n=1 Tax=Roseicitreum antarcticum TaxID=564137 RepID=A0A1H2URP1_9RHOB|nr:flagellar type III secretion system pore protein FliP [Roseicitreum antarcticum]SDW58796.1 flagellar biosynthetic protein FliP [Roseicitreum antarcticum]